MSRIRTNHRRPRRGKETWLGATGLMAAVVLVVALAPGHGARAARQDAPYRLDRTALSEVGSAFTAAERIRAVLAADGLTDVEEAAGLVSRHLTAARERVPESAGRTRALLTAAIEAAGRLAPEEGIDPVRHAFGELSRYLIALAGDDERLTEGWHVFYCPMTPTFPKWFQKEERLANPYYGSSMLTCGSPTTWAAEIPPALLEPAADPAAGHEHGPDEIAWYTCPMHPSIHASAPGPCPICGMDLEPVLRSEVASGVVIVDGLRQQKIGVRIAPVVRDRLEIPVRAVGHVTWDQDRLTDVSLKVSGWVHELFVGDLSRRVTAGEVLFTLYSPELYAAQRDYLQLLGSAGPADALTVAARERLLLWDLTSGQIDEVARRGEPSLYVPILSPADGHVVALDVVRGAAVRAGQQLYRIADPARVWVEAQVYESDLPLLQPGQPAVIRLSYLPERTFRARIDRVYPYLDAGTRTGRVRLVVDNPDLVLKPDMYAEVELPVALGTVLQVPASAVIYTGPRRIVMVEVGEGRFQPREVRIGRRSGEMLEVLEGLAAGERVVRSGTFLIAAESRLRSAAGYWEGSPQGSGGHDGH